MNSEMSESRASMRAGSATAGNENANPNQSASSLLGFESGPNPFEDPGDERIFTFKDTERIRKEQER